MLFEREMIELSSFVASVTLVLVSKRTRRDRIFSRCAHERVGLLLLLEDGC